jgi:Fe-S cluster biogenesis protein NfuA
VKENYFMAIEKLKDQLASLKPVLDSAGRAIEIVSFDTPMIVFRLSGFCGGCECSGSYKEGLQDLVAEHCPEFSVIEFIEA